MRLGTIKEGVTNYDKLAITLVSDRLKAWRHSISPIHTTIPSFVFTTPTSIILCSIPNTQRSCDAKSRPCILSFKNPRSNPISIATSMFAFHTSFPISAAQMDIKRSYTTTACGSFNGSYADWICEKELLYIVRFVIQRKNKVWWRNRYYGISAGIATLALAYGSVPMYKMVSLTPTWPLQC